MDGGFPADKEAARSSPDGLPGEAERCGGKKTGQTAVSGCGHRF